MKFSKEFKIGGFAIAVMVMSFFMINYLMGEDLFNREYELSSRYDNLEGLTESAPVFIKGFKAGKVSDIVYQPETNDFLVTCSLLNEFKVPSDSKMTIYSVDIMGGKGIRIDLGNSESYTADGDTLAPCFEAGLMDGLSGGVGDLLAKVNLTLDSLSTTVSGINRLLSDGNQTSLSSSLAHLEKTLANVSSLSSVLDGRSDELDSFVVNMSALSGKLDSIAVKADSVMAGVSSTVAGLSETDLEGLISSFKELINNFNDPDGTLGRIMSDDSVYDSLESLLSDVDELVRKIQENPKKYLRISVF